MRGASQVERFSSLLYKATPKSHKGYLTVGKRGCRSAFTLFRRNAKNQRVRFADEGQQQKLKLPGLQSPLYTFLFACQYISIRWGQ